ncbi:MAG: hypothetical protein JSS86_21150, partial [Cyanobacteria bacterium SZAS LIN-2]|nr:hypothetical protein [Cyanobacteria bacterium SZAS LIN-2]
KNACVWQRTPQGTKVCGLTIPDVLIPDSLRVKSRPGDTDGTTITDYVLDPKWGIVLAKSTASSEMQNVFIDYEVKQWRIHTIVATHNGNIQVLAGHAYTGSPSPPAIPENTIPILNVLASPLNESLTMSSILPIIDAHPAATSNPSYLKPSKTISRLKQHLPLKICFLGDSVTCGCCATTKEASFPMLLVRKLRHQFPGSEISYSLFCKGGSTSTSQFASYLKHIQDEAAAPDLVVIEFVNDLQLPANVIQQNYQNFVSAMQGRGAEVIVCIPHLVHPTYYGFQANDWRSIANLKYFGLIHELSRKCKFSIADMAFRSQNSAIEGLSPELILADRINHPNNKGHEMYAEEVMKCLQ